MPAITITDVRKDFPARGTGAPVRALENVSLNVAEGEILCIVGPSGCGKTTLLNILAGFERPSFGQATFNGKEIAGPHPDRGVVFQEAALFPWLTASQNIAFGLKEKGVPRRDRSRVAAEFLELVGLRDAGDRLPAALSGGMRQRVALARALATGASALFLDEPFAALDARSRSQMHTELLRIWGEVRTTMVLITHSIDEALILADRVVAMAAQPGRVLEAVDVDLPRPRDDTSVAFNDLKRHLRGLIESAGEQGEAAV